MCGIVGQLNRPGGAPVAAETVRAMCATIVHRGPDDEGVVTDGTLGMGFRRLSINDLAGGHQPLGNEDGSVLVVCNGEIYNSPELRQRLEARGHRFASHSDIAVIPHLYEEYGTDFVEHLDGMFALALWDTRRRRLVLARDPLGIKPLYVAERDGALAFASETAPLVATGWCDALDFTSLHHYLSLGYIPAPGSIFAGVRKLEPGTAMICDEGRAPVVRRYWELRFDPAPMTRSIDDYADEVLTALRAAVKSHLLSDVPVGVFLSGGVDSSGLVALMSEIAGRRIATFSVGFEEKSFNELELARQVARRYDTDHHEIVVRPDALAVLPALVRHFGEPFADSSAVPVYYVSELARRSVTVVLSGEGGDEVFAGYETYLAGKLASLYRRLPAFLGRVVVPSLVGRMPVSHAKVSIDFKAKRFVAGAHLPLADGHFAWKVVLSEAAQAELCVGAARNGATETAALFRDAAARAGSDDWLARLQAIDAHVYLPDNILTKADRMSMAHSLEARVPYLDRTLVELAARLPSAAKLHGWKKKYVLKHALRDHVPAAILHGKKRGFNVPVPAWLRGDLRAMVADVLSPAALTRVGLFEPSYVQTTDRRAQRHEGRSQPAALDVARLHGLARRVAARPHRQANARLRTGAEDQSRGRAGRAGGGESIMSMHGQVSASVDPEARPARAAAATLKTEWAVVPVGRATPIWQRIAAAIGLVLLSPLTLLIAIASKAVSPGPILYRGQRVGRGGKLFTIFKFRTLEIGAEQKIGARLLEHADGLYTRIGRLLKRGKLDEIPQLWNVMRGEMNLVGPRPVRPVFLETFCREIPGYMERFAVNPGMTGLAQVRGGYFTHPRDKLRYDLLYIANQSWWFDVRLVTLTFIKVLNRWLTLGVVLTLLFLSAALAPSLFYYPVQLDLGSFKLGPFEVLVAVTAIWLVVQRSPRHELCVYDTPLNQPMGVFVGFALAAAAISPTPVAALQGVAYYVATGFFLTFLIVNTRLSQREANLIANVVGLSAVLVCLIGLIQIGLDNQLGAKDAPRMSSTLGNPVLLATYLVLGLPFLLTQMLHSRTREQRDIWVACSTVALIGVFLTRDPHGTRGAGGDGWRLPLEDALPLHRHLRPGHRHALHGGRGARRSFACRSPRWPPRRRAAAPR